MSSTPDLLRFFHPVLPARDLGKKPVRVVLGGERYALWRGPSGRACAVRDACPHRAAPLSLGKVGGDGRLACRYHGWSFDGEGGGHCPSQPGLKVATTAYQVAEREGYLWLARRDVAPAQLDAVAPGGWDGYRLAGAFTTPMQAPLHIMLDNFTEDEHFPYVHQAFGWAPSDWGEVRYEASLHDDRSEASYIGPQRPHPLVTMLGVKRGDWFHNRFETRFDPVRSVYTSHWEHPDGGVRRPVAAKTVVYMLPEGDKTTRFHTFLYLQLADGSWHARMRPLIERIALGFVQLEWWMDGRWTRHLADTVPDLKGQRLGKFDKTVIRNRKLLQTVYWGRAGSSIEAA